MPPRYALCRFGRDTRQSQQQRSGHADLQGGQGDCPRRVEIEAQRLVDRDLDGAGGGSAAERQHQREAGGAEHENEAGGPWQQSTKDRPFDKAEEGGGRHAEIGGRSPVFQGDALEPGKKETCDKRHIEEDVGKQDAEKAIDADRLLQPEPRKGGVEHALPAPDLDQPERADQHGQAERQGHKPQHPDAARKARPARQCPCDRYGEENRKQRRKARLQQREAGYPPDIGIEQHAIAEVAALEQKGCNRQTDEQQDAAES